MNKERGWVARSREQFEEMVNDEKSAMVIGNPAEVAAKIVRHDKTLGGISRFNFQMDVGMSHEAMKSAIQMIGQKVVPEILRIKSNH
ncbi:hypothetical protein [Flagellimonas meridianipacifica]|uniref:hypothetical protein n=1 Tax=Flagellimonas meridianipacifica TaxID=1080225 RepID=UPI000D04EDF9|nr:hypothetical protein [Allomuricauda pacifica]